MLVVNYRAGRLARTQFRGHLVAYPPSRRSRFSSSGAMVPFSLALSRVFQHVRPLPVNLRVVNPSKLAQPSHPCSLYRSPAASSEMGITSKSRGERAVVELWWSRVPPVPPSVRAMLVLACECHLTSSIPGLTATTGITSSCVHTPLK